MANTGYMLQLATPYYEELTVRENVTFATMIKMPSSSSLAEKFKRAEQVLEVVRKLDSHLIYAHLKRTMAECNHGTLYTL